MKVPDRAQLATMSSEEIARTLRLPDQTVQELSKTIAQNPRSTIEPGGPLSDTAGRRALDDLGQVRDKMGVAGGLAIEHTIGEGGMGIVRIATQRSLGRKVAVKTIRPESRTEKATLHLLREAWVTGSLEHPNIVPVYDLGLDPDGSPIIVLKKIEGVEWAKVLPENDLEQNLRILMQVCNAVSLAHTRGILHRDLKPENVMIGSFGEVYLVDWGIAVSLEEDPSGRLPHAKSAKEIAGTPCYMAPEMLGTGDLSARTDVYLLGAILHEILTGKPPHQGNFGQILASILTGAFTYDDGVPPELGAIAKKAMSLDPDERFPTAEALRERLEWYLRHRGSLGLSSEAQRRLQQMQELVVKGAERDDVYRLFAEARFGFRQALATSADNRAAKEGLREAIETMVAYELERGTPDAASAALAELEQPPQSLVLRVGDARKKERAERERLQRVDASLDMQVGRRTRLFVSVILGALWILAPLTGPALETRFAEYGHRVLYAWTIVLTLVAWGLGRWARESLSKTIINRNAAAAVLVMLAGQFSLQIACGIAGIPFHDTLLLHFVLWGMSAGFTAIMVDKALMPSAGAYWLALFAAAKWPGALWYVAAASHTFLFANFVVAWGKFEEDRPRAVHERIKRRLEERQSSRRPPPNTRSP